MNKDKMIELLEDGAYFDSLNSKFFHPSFRKGWRKITTGNISWLAVDRLHGILGTGRLLCGEDSIYTLAPTAR